ncbi:hypothetical protein M9458_035403, partial [Cirrhinus mrigala]
PAERNYDIDNRELLAVRLALGDPSWSGRTIKTWNTSHQARWALFFNRFNFTLSYRPGSKNTKPDALSRLFEVPETVLAADAILPKGVVVGAIVWDIER